jgi:SAM-dependent methyltransferase
MHEAPEKPPEFDSYARDYAALLHDPIRERFAPESRFFIQRKLDVIRAFCAERKLDMRTLEWLDVGCGRGDLLRMGRPFFAASAGCDLSQGMLEACRDLEVRRQDTAEQIPWADASFDFITAVCVFHHVPLEQRLALIKDMLRVLRPNGCVCIIEHNPLNPVTRLVVSRSPVDANAKLLGARETKRLVTSVGGQILGTRYFLYFPESLFGYAGRLEKVLGLVPLGGQYAIFFACARGQRSRE